MKKILFPILALVLAVALVIPMAATVSADDGEPLVYGMQRNTATIYGINPTDGTVSVTMDTELWASEIGPNGLAYDEDNDIIYWVTYYDANPDQVKLCYWNDAATEYPWHIRITSGLESYGGYLPDGTPDKGVTCADFYDGKYYYIPNNTDDLYAVTIVGDTVTNIDVMLDISGGNNYAWNFGGDIAIGPDGVIYGVGDATPTEAGGPYHFFSVERNGTGFNLIDPSVHTFSLQLAFALDGVLYGHESQDDGLFYAVDTTNGNLSAAYPNSTMYLYTDLASGPRPPEEKCGDLIAGQHFDVGDVTVSNDGTTLYVTYEITDPDWRITETHLYVGKNLSPTTAPGQFPYDDDDATSVTDTEVTYGIPLTGIDGYHMQLNNKGKPTGKMVADGDPGVVPCNDIYIAAHAVVIKVIGEGCSDPIWASNVEGYDQGTERDGSAVAADRSDPTKALSAPDSIPPPYSFYSLGFDLSDSGDGWIELSFGYPIYNGMGDDIVSVEITSRKDNVPPYYEVADVYVVVDGVEYYAGTVNNYDPVNKDTWNWVSIPDGFLYVDSIKLYDATDPAVFPLPTWATMDGYDLDAVGVCYLLEQEETAWGWCETNGGEFPGANWATYMTYHVQ